MSEDIVAKIQLGLILPKLKEKVQRELTSIIEEQIIGHSKNGVLDGEDPISIEAVKEVVMQNLETFLDRVVLPPIDKKFNPPVEKKEGEAEPEAA